MALFPLQEQPVTYDQTSAGAFLKSLQGNADLQAQYLKNQYYPQDIQAQIEQLRSRAQLERNQGFAQEQTGLTTQAERPANVLGAQTEAVGTFPINQYRAGQRALAILNGQAAPGSQFNGQSPIPAQSAPNQQPAAQPAQGGGDSSNIPIEDREINGNINSGYSVGNSNAPSGSGKLDMNSEDTALKAKYGILPVGQQLQLEAAKTGATTGATSENENMFNLINEAKSAKQSATDALGETAQMRDLYPKTARLSGHLLGKTATEGVESGISSLLVPGGDLSPEQNLDSLTKQVGADQAKLYAHDTGRLMNSEVQLFKNNAPKRSDDPAAFNQKLTTYELRAQRMQEMLPFVTAMQAKGLNSSQIKEAWLLYNEQKPTYDIKNKVPIPQNIKGWDEYTTPNAIAAIQNHNGYEPVNLSPTQRIRMYFPQQGTSKYIRGDQVPLAKQKYGARVLSYYGE